ncbi:protein MraZ [Atopobium sp. oral taxon 810]|uniref:division/cell wall cluster transcriptional repressor MraZ n=1 Tax=Atopobium sp. oral taxon 810 TaxID=712158 RepID=UPI000397D1C3|nr:protein MraZ [Atopobium sp. oral taxon 810]ERI03972.1 putative protein MraZ [Atopobium sp. oral taxon 810 str. F0209]
MYLTGSKRANLDSKCRLTLQADYRRDFPDGKIKLVPVQGALYGFTLEGYVSWVTGVCPNASDPKSADARRARALNSHAVEVDIDAAGRISVGKSSEHDRERLGLKREVVIAGNGDHFEIWDAARWDQLQADAEDEEFEAYLFG